MENIKELKDEYKELNEKWQDIYKNGAKDNTWTDGMHLNLIRTQMRRILVKLKQYDIGEEPRGVPPLPEKQSFEYYASSRKKTAKTVKATEAEKPAKTTLAKKTATTTEKAEKAAKAQKAAKAEEAEKPAKTTRTKKAAKSTGTTKTEEAKRATKTTAKATAKTRKSTAATKKK